MIKTLYVFFFFISSRSRHTRWPRDWSSDVCSSDLGLCGVPDHGEDVPVDVTDVALVEALEGAVPRVVDECRRHDLWAQRARGRRGYSPIPWSYAAAGARGLRFGTWIARPSATRPASLIASESVGCGAMPSATVSTVDSASIATTAASIMSVTCGPTITMPSSSPYRVSWIDLTQPTVSSCITARAFAIHGNRPTATSSPYSSRASASVRPTAAISGSV